MRTTTPLVFVAVFAMATYVANLNDELSACTVPVVFVAMLACADLCCYDEQLLLLR